MYEAALMIPGKASDELGNRYESKNKLSFGAIFFPYLNDGHSLHSFAGRLLQERPHMLNLVLHLGYALGRAQQLQRPGEKGRCETGETEWSGVE